MAVTTSVEIGTQWLTDVSSNFIGYYIAPSSTQTLSAGDVWATSGAYAGDCGTADCVFATNCANNILTYGNGATASCGDSFSCVTMTIFQTSPDGSPSASNIDCRVGWAAYTVYRELEVLTTSTVTISGTSTSTSSASSASSTSPPSQTSTSTTATPTVTPSPHSSSKAWIAGAVIGPIAGIALIALLFWLVRRRKSQKQFQPNTSRPPVELHGQGLMSPPFELSSTRTPAELSSTDRKYSAVPTELPAND